MTVHIDELHSDVVAAEGPDGGDQVRDQGKPPWAAEASWRERRDQAEWLAGRVSAADFDD